jgi:hypothetical protein
MKGKKNNKKKETKANKTLYIKETRKFRKRLFFIKKGKKVRKDRF